MNAILSLFVHQVRKIQLSKTLSTELLNNALSLLKMQDGIARLMEKCEKITEKMSKIVEDLTEGVETRMELTEQPGIINKKFKIKQYQLIG